MKRTNKTEITKNEYYQLMGLRAVADRLWLMIKEIEITAQQITDEVDGDGKPDIYGHTGDYLSGSRDLDELLSILEIKVNE